MKRCGAYTHALMFDAHVSVAHIVAYLVLDDVLGCVISSYHGVTDGVQYKQYFADAIHDMAAVFQENA